MKKSLLALAVLSGFASVASAQTSIVLYGVIDGAVRREVGVLLESCAAPDRERPTHSHLHHRLQVRDADEDAFPILGEISAARRQRVLAFAAVEFEMGRAVVERARVVPSLD